mgnify:CR=1 FL=1
MTRLIHEPIPENLNTTKLPDEEEERIVKANRLLGLHFAAWDIIVSKTNNRYVYLDCNPGPYIMWTGPENRMYVFRQLANYMITYSQTDRKSVV